MILTQRRFRREKNSSTYKHPGAVDAKDIVEVSAGRQAKFAIHDSIPLPVDEGAGFSNQAADVVSDGEVVVAFVGFAYGKVEEHACEEGATNLFRRDSLECTVVRVIPEAAIAVCKVSNLFSTRCMAR